MKNFLISGCSYVQNQTWPKQLVNSDFKICNLGRSGAGNTYISNSITANLHQKPNFVFVLWSGINRIELRTPTYKTFNKYQSTGLKHDVGNSRYWFSGGAVDVNNGWLAAYNAIRDESWPEITSLAQWFDLSDSIKQECLESKINLSTIGGRDNIAAFINHYFLTQYLNYDKKYYSELTFQNMMNCFNLLEKLKIPYRFSSIYDMFSTNHYYSLGQASKEQYYNYINWDNYISLTPYEYAIKYDLLGPDQFHPSAQGFETWATEIAKILRQQADLQHLF